MPLYNIDFSIINNENNISYNSIVVSKSGRIHVCNGAVVVAGAVQISGKYLRTSHCSMEMAQKSMDFT